MRVGRLYVLDDVGGLADLVERELFSVRDVHEHALGALHGALHERAFERHAHGFFDTVFAARGSNAHDCASRAAHDGVEVGEVDVYEPGARDEVRDPLHRLAQNFVGERE